MTLDDTQYNSRYAALKKIAVLLYGRVQKPALLLLLIIQMLLILAGNVKKIYTGPTVMQFSK